MVGVPTSRGCETCRKRKIKCDEGRPACTQCVKGNRVCPGYTFRLKFQDEGPQLKRRYNPSTKRSGRKQSQQSSTDSDEGSLIELKDDTSTSVSSRSGSHDSADNDTSNIANILKKVAFFSRAGPTTMSTSSESRLGSQFIQTILSDLPKGMNLIIFGGFLKQVPQRLGSNKALDDAVECLYVAHQAFLRGEADVMLSSRHQYGKALRSLQQCITDKKEGTKPETLCATMLLGIYEIFAGTSGSSWVRHAGGCARLIELRGPDHYKNEFELELLASQRGTIAIESILMRKECFLERPEWEEVFLTARQQLPPEHQIYDNLMHEMTQLPTLLKQATALRREVAPLRSTVMHLKSRVLAVREGLQKFQRETLSADAFQSYPMPAKHPESPWDTVYHFYDNYLAGLVAVHNGCLILVNCILENLPDPVPSREEIHAENEKLSDLHLRVWEYAEQYAPLGSMYIWFSLRAAYMVVTDINLKMWCVNRLNESLAAMQLSGYEPVTLESMDYYFGDFIGPIGLTMRDD